MHRTLLRPALILAGVAVPAMLVAGCSSGSDKDAEAAKKSDEATVSASPSPTVAAAKYRQLPEVCKTVTTKTVARLVPQAKPKSGRTLPSSDADASGSCLWTGLDGYQYRSLTVSLKLFTSDPAIGAGETRAQEYAGQQAERAATADGAKDAATGTATGLGDEAHTVRTRIKKDGDEYRDQTVVTRTANVVVTVEYDGAGYEDAKAPDAAKLLKDAEAAAREALAAVADTAPDAVRS